MVIKVQPLRLNIMREYLYTLREKDITNKKVTKKYSKKSKEQN